MRGPYQLQERARRRDRTVERLVAAAADLHGEVGPAFTTMAQVAERAGVSRMTAYRHFPTERDLFRACARHFITTHPLPAPERWLQSTDPEERLGLALGEIYCYYRRHRRRIGNVLRDSHTLPVGAVFREAERTWAEALLRAWPAATQRRRSLRASIVLAVHFETWDHLAAGGIGDGDIIRLMRLSARAAAETAIGSGHRSSLAPSGPGRRRGHRDDVSRRQATPARP